MLPVTVKLNLDNKPAAKFYMSLHADKPVEQGDARVNEVAYPGYARQPLLDWKVSFPTCVSDIRCTVTHAAIVTDGGAVLVAIRLWPAITVELGTSPTIQVDGFSDDLIQTSDPGGRSGSGLNLLSSRYAAIAAEIDED